MIQLQRHHRGTTVGRAPYDVCTIFTPLEMARPPLASRIKQTGPPSGQRIAGRYLPPLETVTHPAGQPEVRFLVSPTTGCGDDVVDFQ